MSMNLPQICRSGNSCRSCRDTSTAGEDWRQSARDARLIVPYHCPLDKPWVGSDPPPPAPHFVVPLLAKGHRGALLKPPESYRVTAAVPHLNTPEMLAVVIDLLRLQTVRPYILVIDTGSPRHVRDALEDLYEPSPDVEVHSIRSKGGQHSSDLVCHAMDLAFARCPTELLFATHADCFLRRRDFLDDLAGKCNAVTPSVGYGMSPREGLTDQWRQCIGHVAAMHHMPTMDGLGVTWGIRRAAHQWGEVRDRSVWPDTETSLSLVLRDAGVKPLLIGVETNCARQTNDDFDHCRSTSGGLVYNEGMYAERAGLRESAMREARARAAEWRAEDAEKSPPPPVAPPPSADDEAERLARFHALWDELHAYPLKWTGPKPAMKFLAGFGPRVPCGPCRTGWQADLAAFPPDVTSPAAMARWGWAAHNRVSERQGKPGMAYEAAARVRGWGSLE